jgi:hypothetical protein
MNLFKRSFYFILLTGLVSFTNLQKEKETRLLFLGNSLTYTNDLPKLVSGLAAENGRKISVETIAFPNYALEDHWNDGKIQTMIASGKYNFVIVQQGPSSQDEGRVMLLDYGAKLSKLCSQHNTQLAFYMVWPAIPNYKSFDGVIQNYTDAAKQANAILCPVGKKWKEYIDETKDYSYYGPDGFHPSLKGSEVAAEIIYNTLFMN